MASYDSPGFQDRTPAGPVNQSTGAPGSEGVSASDTAGAVIGSAQPRSVLFAPSVPVPEVRVHAGDTTGFSDDQPIHQSPLLPHAAEASSTGAGDGNVVTPHHPNATRTPL